MRPSPTADERPILARNRTSQGFYRCSFMSSRPRYGGPTLSHRTSHFCLRAAVKLVGCADGLGNAWVGPNVRGEVGACNAGPHGVRDTRWPFHISSCLNRTRSDKAGMDTAFQDVFSDYNLQERWRSSPSIVSVAAKAMDENDARSRCPSPAGNFD